MTLDLLPDAVVRVDAARRLVEANAAAAELTGYAPAELVGADCAELLRPRGRDGKALWRDGWPPSAALRSVRRIPEQQVTLRCREDADVTVHVTGSYQRAPDGAVCGAVLVLREATMRAREAVSGIEVVSTVSHELRSPLTSVKGYTSLLLNRWDRLTDDQKRMMLEQVHHDADRVTRLITELLDISRLETGRLVLHRRLVDLEALAREVVDKVRLTEPALECELAFGPTVPKVPADPDKVEQVLTNLVENAAKYASTSGMRVEGSLDDGVVRVAVVDRGRGIPEDDLTRVFAKYFRRADGRPSGSGLGLWISRGLVEAHGGRLTAESTPGVGSTFAFTLPLDPPDEEAA